MTKDQLAKLKLLKLEVKQLQEELHHMPTIRDNVSGSMNVFPYVKHSIPIEGIDVRKTIRVQKKLKVAMENLQTEIIDMESWLEEISDPEMRTILRMYYRDGNTQEQIAEKMGRSEKTIQRKFKKFFQMSCNVRK